jgi:DNA-directed RNA polymerase subunit alpha
MGLSLKDSAPGFDPLSAISRFDDLDEDEVDFSETEQY